jgi:hypothetical protein
MVLPTFKTRLYAHALIRILGSGKPFRSFSPSSLPQSIPKVVGTKRYR